MAEALDGPAGGEAAFGARLRRARLAAGLTQEALAERAGLSARGIQDLERGLRATPQRQTVRLLGRALGLAPEAVAALEATVVRARRTGPAAGDSGPGPAGPPAGGRLPRPLTSFVGRERELAEVGRLLGTVRLLTLTGPGGVGKTRLAVAAAGLAGGAPDGVAFAALAPLADPAHVAVAVATALGVPGLAGRPPEEALLAHLRARALLVVLDNCEHVLAGAAPLVAGLLAACPGVRVLATSREVLRLSGEHVLAVSPLALPAPPPPPAGGAPAAPEHLAAAPAVRLFCERAAAADAAFALTAENAGAVAEVCRRLDGLPLALELAAARSRLLPPRELLARLERRLPLLTGGPRDAPARQQTLRATLAWSHDLLAPDERVLFRRLAVFAGGCDLAAAEAVCAAGAGEPAVDVLGGVASLVDKSLVQRPEAPGGGARVVMLETLREFAAEQLERGGEAAALGRRHAEHFTRLAERAAPALHGPQQREWFDRLERERDNLRAALRWAVGAAAAPSPPETRQAAAALGLRLGQALFWFWLIRGPLHEGLPWLRRLLALPGAGGPVAQAWTCHYAAVLEALVSGHHSTAARSRYEEALASAQATGQLALVAEAQNGLGHMAWAAGDYARARRHLEAALRAEAAARAAPAPASGPPGPHRLVPIGALWALVRVAVAQGDVRAARAWAEEGLASARASGDPFHELFGLAEMGEVAAAVGDLAAARRWAAASLRRARAVGVPAGIAHALRLLGLAAGDPQQARARYAESLALYRELGEQHFVAEVLSLLGDAALALGDAADARARYREALALGRRFGLQPVVAAALEGLAALATAEGGHERAIRLAGTAAAQREAAGAPLAPPARARHEARLLPARRRLPAGAQAAAFAAGGALSLEQAIAYALEDAPDPA